jgi:hypothetical protein
LASFHVTPAFFIAAEKPNPGTKPLLLPTTPARDGPILITPLCVEWHTAQWLAKMPFPAVGLPAAKAIGALAGDGREAGEHRRLLADRTEELRLVDMTIPYDDGETSRRNMRLILLNPSGD